jgi:hypothetical protein
MCILRTISDELYDDTDTRAYACVEHVVRQALAHLNMCNIDVRVVDPDHIGDTVSDCIQAIVDTVYAKHAVGVGVAPTIQEQHAAHVATREAYRNMIGEQFAYALSQLGATQRAPLN